MSELYVSWDGYHHNIEILAAKIYDSGWEFNQIVCLAKGGLRVGDILSRLYRQPLAILIAASYGGSNNQIRGKIKFSKHLTNLEESLGSKILLVDDLVDSGISLRESINWLKTNYKDKIEEIRTAVIWYKKCSNYQPDFYVQYLEDNPWIHQPFEKYEQITLQQLLESNINL